MIPGNIILNTWVFPEIKYNNRHWLMCVRLYKGRQLQHLPAHITDNLTAKYQVLTWRDNQSPELYKVPTIVTEGRQGRNVWEQALFEANKKWQDKKAKHSGGDTCGTVPPMLLKVMDEIMTPARFEAIDADWYCQKKYNGVRCVACINGNVKLFSRRLKQYNVPTIESALAEFFAGNASNSMNNSARNKIDNFISNKMLDGELYIHKMPLQLISGIVRAENDPDKVKLKYVIFDFYDFKNKDLSYVRRMEILEDLFESVNSSGSANSSNSQNIILAPTDKIGKSTDYPAFERRMNSFYNKYLEQGYEGIILRRADGVYVPSFHGRETDLVMKHKPKQTKEYKCTGYETGRGKESGAVIWICQVHGIEFRVRPKQSYAERRQIYSELQSDPGAFAKKYKNKPYTVEYDSLSINGVPQQPRGLLFRTYE